MKLSTKILFWFRDAFWNLRKAIRKDAFETDRTHWICGLISLNDFITKKEQETGKTPSFETLVNRLKCYIMLCDMDCGNIPVLDCALQYEEDGQLFSAHWYLDEKYQLHVRFFDVGGRSQKALLCREVEVRGHKEIRPDFDALAHLRGKEITDGCVLFWKIYGGDLKCQTFS